jgi:exosome complex component RRP4
VRVIELSERRIVLPGEKVFDSSRQTDSCIKDGNGTYATSVSVAYGDRVVPLKGVYVPTQGERVIGIISDLNFHGYRVDINSPYDGKLSDQETLEDLGLGDVVTAGVQIVTETNECTLIEPQRLSGGDILEVPAVKVPRIIGRQGSMLKTIKDLAGTDVFVGKNGRVYLKNGNVSLAAQAIMKICRESHTSGLTERVTSFLKEGE